MISPLTQSSRPAGSTSTAPPALAHPAYRPDIDGLRAIAVGAVVLYHAFPASGRGGFVGVDVFFIISGFLISTIIFGNLQRDTFSVLEFYIRRIRRIFPALLTVLVATFAVGWATLLADEFEQLGKHVAGGASFVSNLVFWGESGYFDNAGETKPLLHLWSLGIEEQYYIVWPLVAWAAWRRRANLLLLTAVMALASFVYNVHLVATDPVADFYSPLSRFWELALGSGLAYAMLFERDILTTWTPRQRDALSVAGAVVLAAGLVATTSDSAFPGWWALLPTCATVAIIAAGSNAWFNRTVLAHRAMVWLGLISFPLYLWHWPILSFIRILAAERPTRLTRIAAIAAAVLLAWLTYRFVERPVRTGTRRRWLPAALLAAVAVVGGLGFTAFRDGGFAFRQAAQVAIVHPGDIGHDAFYAYATAHFRPCMPVAIHDQAEIWNHWTRCFQSHDGPIDVALVGDSHAEHLFVGLAEALAPRNVVFYTRSSLPVVGNPAFDDIFRTVVEDRDIRTVILSAWWTLRIAREGGIDAFTRQMQATLNRLRAAGKQVYIADDVPNFSFSPRLCKYGPSLFRRNRCDEDRAFFAQQYRNYLPVLETIASNSPNVHLLNTTKYFCDAARCSMIHDGQLLFRDSDHLNLNGSRFLGRQIARDYPRLAEETNASRAPGAKIGVLPAILASTLRQTRDRRVNYPGIGCAAANDRFTPGVASAPLDKHPPGHSIAIRGVGEVDPCQS